jgi:2-hydroxy-3-keto-5-methylthiopentenyl-1-phosphate phosphatase
MKVEFIFHRYVEIYVISAGLGENIDIILKRLVMIQSLYNLEVLWSKTPILPFLAAVF